MSTSRSVLRLAVLDRGRILDERTFPKPQRVHIGPEGELARVPGAVALFGLRRGRPTLRLTDSLRGQLARPGHAAVDFEAIRAASGQGELEVELALGTKGRALLGERLVLFQVVPAPAPAPKPVLPPEARGRTWERLDGTFLVVLAAFLAADFTGLAALSRRPIVAEDVELAELDRPFVHAPMYRKPPMPETKQKAVADAHAPKAAPTIPHASPEHIASLGIVGAVNHLGGFGVGDVLGERGASQDIADALKDAHGKLSVDDGSASPELRGTSVGEAARIEEPKTHGGHAVNAGDHADAELPVVVDLQPPIIDKAGLPPELVARFVKAHLRSIEACYERELKRNRALHGRLELRFTVGSSGSVVDAEIGDDALGNAEVRECVLRLVRHWGLPAHPPEDVEVSYPLVFAPMGS